MIYLVEDDDNIRELVLYTLKGQGMPARGFDRPSTFWAAMEQEAPTLVLLDIMLPEEDGVAVLKKLRANSSTRRLPIILLTAKSSEYDTVLGLDAGADDYIAKPFRMMELLARVKALLRRTDESAPPAFTVGPLYVCPARHEVRVNDRPVVLTLKEFELLCVFLENPGLVLTRAQLLDRIWGYSFDGESRTVDVHIGTLRQKLGEAGSYIETVRGLGYRFEDKTE